MSSPILICDDSNMARKQLARSLPFELSADITYACNGQEALDVIQDGMVIFLDLTMPVLDGYETLAAIKQRGIDCRVVVVSGDVQTQAVARVKALGAVGFIKKPAAADLLLKICHKLKLVDPKATAVESMAAEVKTRDESLSDNIDWMDAYRELSNVSVGRTASLLADLLGVFVHLPVPRVNMLERTELHMALDYLGGKKDCSAVCQSFIGPGISGEALLIFHQNSYRDIAKLMKMEQIRDCASNDEQKMDIANILIGSCLKGIAQQLDINLNQGSPAVLDENLDHLVDNDQQGWQQALAIEVDFTMEGVSIECDLLLLITEESIPVINQRLRYVM